MREEGAATLLSFFREGRHSRHHLSIVDEIMDDGFPASETPFRSSDGPVADAAKIFSDAFPDCYLELREQFAECDIVATRFTLNGTHSGAFLGIPATGKKVHLEGLAIDLIEEEFFSVSTFLVDTSGIASLPPLLDLRS